jgi:lysophospholipase L1-like esterase
MKFASISVSNTVFILVIIGIILCQTPNNTFRLSEKLLQADKVGIKFKNKETQRAEDRLLLPLRQDNATKLLITEGSSSTEGYGAVNEYPRQLAVLFGGNYYKQTLSLILDSNNLWTVRNVGNGGDTMTQITAQYATQVLPFYNPSLNVNYLTLQGGSNDIANGRTTTALKTDVTSYVARAKADGFLVGVCTVFHRVGNDVAKVSDYNNWLRAGNSGADFIIDLAAHPFLSDATNPTYFLGDGIHTNNAGQTVIAGIFAEAVQTITVASEVFTVRGRVLTANGRGISNVALTLTDLAGNTRTARTSALGYYQFRGVTPGQTYSVTASAKRFNFNQPSQTLNINSNTVYVNFIADP